jgi:hypothetical protein
MQGVQIGSRFERGQRRQAGDSLDIDLLLCIFESVIEGAYVSSVGNG